MKKLEQATVNFLSAIETQNEQALANMYYDFSKTIKKNEQEIKFTNQPYPIARAMYYLLNNYEHLLEEDQNHIVLLIYYCLLKNYILLKDSEDPSKYDELISGCELAFNVMMKNGEFLIYQILCGGMNFLPNFAQQHIVNQMCLFGGMAKDAIENGYSSFTDNRIHMKFSFLLSKVYENIPTGEVLENYKNNCLPIIKDISNSISFWLKSDDDYELFF